VTVRPINLLVVLACSIPAAPGAVSETLKAQKRIQPVELEQLLSAPEQFQTSLVKFTCVFAELGNLFDTLHTNFRPERYYNLVVWDDDAKLWDPAVRSDPLLSVYLSKDLKFTEGLADLHKYQVVEIIGRVTSVADGRPWLDVTKIRPVTGAGAFSDNSIYHIQQALALGNDGVRDLADEHFLEALKEPLPPQGHALVQEMRARQLVAAGRYKDAIVALDDAIATLPTDARVADPELAQLHALLAKAQNESAETASTSQRQELLGSAVTHARTALAHDPSLADAYAVLGISLAGLGQFDEARRECDNALRLRPNDAEVRWYLGRILDQQGKYDESIDALKKAIDLTPKDARIHKAIAGAYHHRGVKGGPNGGVDLTTALREYDIALRLNPTDTEVNYLAGLVVEAAAEAGAEIQTATGKQAATRDMAAERYKSALSGDETFAPAHRALADLYRNQGRFEDAAAQYLRVVELQPDDFDSVTALAGFLDSQSKSAEAIATYEGFLAKHPQHPEALAALARSYQQAGDAQRSRQLASQLEQQVKAKPKSASALLALAEYRLAIGEAGSASDLAKKAWDLADRSSKTRAAATFGKARWELGDVKGALSALAPIIDQTTDKQAMLDLGWAYVVSGKLNEAKAVADKLRTPTFAGPASLEFLGWMNYLTGDFQQAEQQLRKASIKDPLIKAYRLGMTLFKQGPTRFQEARPLLNAAKNLTVRPGISDQAPREVSAALKVIGGDAAPVEKTGSDSAKSGDAADAARTADEAGWAYDKRRAV
jgi:tetratricopeptide (TPR) repeat protein